MNLYFRMFLMYLLAPFRSKVKIADNFISNRRVWPNDLDLIGHMNNGRYLTLCDIERVELLIRLGIWYSLKKKGVVPVLSGVKVQYRKPL